jgi:hypothetical protein|tara:strand:- start:451 stop:666 length:216 start_codon:yes stop_codon:yes gene_type:complete
MSLEFFKLTTYIEFILPAFIFTFISCLTLYLNTIKELKKYEKMFKAEIETEKYKEIKSTKESQTIPGSLVF